ncbi:MAG: putative sporulation protein YtxC [Clostridiales bacterium]|nr:putative sporulation protein YtxC [Clostridiales bacterium]
MLVLKLAYFEEMDFILELQELREILKKKNINLGFVESIEGNTHIIKVMCNDNEYNEKTFDRINLYISNVLYKLVISQYKKRELFQFLTETYYFLKQEEIIQIEELIMNILNMQEKPNNDILIYCYNKINNIIGKISQCIDENREINVNGFIRFRMKELRNDIESIIDKIVEKYMIEKEYEEFIKLLQYFVDIQESKIDEVNIKIEPMGVYIVTDKEGKDIFSMFLKELTESELQIVDANIEDILISGLITNVPKNIIIHGKNNSTNKEFIKTIVSVFGNRVKFIERNEKCTEINIDRIKT